MPKAARSMLQNGHSYDEPDRMPSNITVTHFDLLLYVVAIVGHLVDLALDINVAVRYSLAKKMMEFGWTLAFILLPAFVNTAVSIRMYAQDKQQDSVTNEFTKRKWLRIFILVLQMAPILRFTDALMSVAFVISFLLSGQVMCTVVIDSARAVFISFPMIVKCSLEPSYAIKSRQAGRKKDVSSQRMYYALMLKEDSDAALLRVFECFLEAAPQQVLQTSLLLRQYDHLAVHQVLSICSSLVGMGWCLAAYQRAVRYAQEDKINMTWPGTVLQTLWHFLVTMSRVASLSAVAYLFPHWTILACAIHIAVMTTWLQFYDTSPFCSHTKLGQMSFSLALGAVYLFTYILPVEGRTRYRYTVYYSICFIQNITCMTLWYVYADNLVRTSIYFYPILVLCVVPYAIGIVFMVIYYAFLHPKRRKVCEISVQFKQEDQVAHIS